MEGHIVPYSFVLHIVSTIMTNSYSVDLFRIEIISDLMYNEAF